MAEHTTKTPDTATRAARVVALCLAASLAASGCFRSHELGSGGSGSGARPGPHGHGMHGHGAGVHDAAVDAGPPRADGGPPRDASTVDPTVPDASPDAAAPPEADAGARCSAPAVAPFGEEDVCAPEVGACIEACDLRRLCIAQCFDGHPRCRDCAVRNAVACFNAEGCRGRWPRAYCCAADACAVERPEDVLNACTLALCFDELNAYADCAVARAELRCRRAIATCGLPPTLLGLGG